MALPRRSEPRLTLPPAVPPQSVLTRPEVAIVPALVMGFGSLGVALSQVLRPAGQAVSANATEIIGSWAVLFAIGAFAMALVIRNSRVLSGPHAIWVYVVGSLSLLGALSIVSLLDSGIATVAFGGVMLLSFYVGFVFPYRLARAGLLVLLALLAALQVAVPRADAIEVVSVFALAITGWLLGRIPRQAFKIAANHALILSRSDVLTRILNRRGFLEEFAFALRTGAKDGRSVALIVIDLNGFKLINDQQGHAAGDEMLAWVAERVGALLPPDAIFGRLGGDEFAVGLPGVSEAAVEAMAKSVHAALAERIGASIGVAAQPLGETGLDDLFRVADVALYAAKADPTRRVQVREADPSGGQVEPDALPAPVTYAKLRAQGGPRGATEPHGLQFDGTWVLAGFTAIAISGLVFVASTWLWGGNSFFEQLIRYGGPPWIIVNLALGISYRNRTLDTWNPDWVPSYMSALLVGIGVGTASLSTGDGVTTPILAGLYLKLLFDGATFRQGMGLRLAAIIGTCWVLVLIFGPADALWAIPFQLVMMVGAFRLGQVGRNAFDAAIRARMALALTDPLTGLLNRRGFMRRADQMVLDAEPGPLVPVVIALDLDDFKLVNDTHGHAAGDALLREVAEACANVLGDEFALGRVGGDEFVAIAPAISVARLDTLVDQLDRRLTSIVAASVGSGVFGRDGIALDQLLQVADHRAYEVKRDRAEANDIRASRGPVADETYEGPERRRPAARGRRREDASADGPVGGERDPSDPRDEPYRGSGQR